MKRGIRFSAWGGRKFVMGWYLATWAGILAVFGKFTAEVAGVFGVIYAGFSYADAHLSGKAIDKGVNKEYGSGE